MWLAFIWQSSPDSLTFFFTCLRVSILSYLGGIVLKFLADFEFEIFSKLWNILEPSGTCKRDWSNLKPLRILSKCVCNGVLSATGLHVAGYLLLYLSACINPIIYVIMNAQYRQAYRSVLACHRQRTRMTASTAGEL